MDDSRIRSKTAPFSFENGLVWTGPQYKSPKLCINPFHKREAAANLLSSATLLTIYAQSMFILIESRVTGVTKSTPAFFTSKKFDVLPCIR